MKVIHSVEEFNQTFKVGDTFWHMQSFCTKPNCIKQETIYGFLAYIGIVDFRKDHPQSVVLLSEEAARESTPTNLLHHIQFVEDLVNTWHGVFTNEQDAQEYYQMKLKEFDNSPEWQQKQQQKQKSIELDMLIDFERMWD